MSECGENAYKQLQTWISVMGSAALNVCLSEVYAIKRWRMTNLMYLQKICQ